MAIGTSLLIVAAGAILAFAVDYRVVGLDINAIGVILIVVGIVGLALSMLVFGSLFGGGHSHRLPSDHEHSGPPAAW
jgi:hypothetical protein